MANASTATNPKATEEAMTDPHTAAMRLLELSGRATEGPWSVTTPADMRISVYVEPPTGHPICNAPIGHSEWPLPENEGAQPRKDMEFIAFARNHAPAICEALLRMEAALRDLVENIDSGVTPEVFAATERDHPQMSTLAYARAALSPRTPQADGET